MAPLTSDPTLATYDRIAAAYAQRNFTPAFWEKEFDVFRTLIRGKRVIDIGCGPGRDAILFLRDGFEYVGIDGSRGMVEEAKKRVPDCTFLQMDFLSLAFPTEQFDGFWASASLLHVPKVTLPHALRELHRILKPEGVGFLSMKEKSDPDEGLIEDKRYTDLGRYFAFYTADEFTKCLDENGFSVLQHHVLLEGEKRWLCFFVRKKALSA